jgi:hypothetical protein
VYLKNDGTLWLSGCTNLKRILDSLLDRMSLDEQNSNPLIEVIHKFNNLTRKAIQSGNVLVAITLEYIFECFKPRLIKSHIERLINIEGYPHCLTKSDELLLMDTDLFKPRDTLSPLGVARFIKEHSTPKVLSTNLSKSEIQVLFKDKDMLNHNNKYPKSIDNYELEYQYEGYEVKFFANGEQVTEGSSDEEYLYQSKFKNDFMYSYSVPFLILFFDNNKNFILHYVIGKTDHDVTEEFILSDMVERYYHTEDMSIWIMLTNSGELVKISIFEDMDGRIIVTKMTVDKDALGFSADGYFVCYNQENSIKVINLITNVGEDFNDRFEVLSKKYKQFGEELVTKTKRNCCITIKI